MRKRESFWAKDCLEKALSGLKICRVRHVKVVLACGCQATKASRLLVHCFNAPFDLSNGAKDSVRY